MAKVYLLEKKSFQRQIIFLSELGKNQFITNMKLFLFPFILLWLSQLVHLCLPSSCSLPTPTGHPLRLCRCPWIIHTCSWTTPFPFFPPPPPPPCPLAAVSLFPFSMSVVLFCSLVYFVHYIPLISEKIR